MDLVTFILIIILILVMIGVKVNWTLTVLCICAAIVTILINTVYQKCTNAVCKSNKRLEGKVVLVTGGTAGMGLEIATDFAHRGAKVIIASPFEEEGTTARRTIIGTTGNEKVIFKLLDLASQRTINKFAADILEEQNRLDILVNNAGVGIPINPKTYNGTNFIMHVNYIGHFLLTILLLPLLRKTGTKQEPSRIINTGSLLHAIGTLDLESKNRQDLIYRIFCYCNSKFCCILFTHVLSKKLKDSNVVVHAVAPGIVGTGILEDFWWGSLAKFIFKYMYKTPWEGAQTAAHAALDEAAGQVTGQFFENCKIAQPKSSAYDDDLGNKLWEESVKIVKLEKDTVYKCLYE